MTKNGHTQKVLQLNWTMCHIVYTILDFIANTFHRAYAIA